MRHLRTLFLLSALCLGAVITVPGPAAAQAADVSDWYTIVEDLPIANGVDLAVSEEHNRVVIAADDKLVLLDLQRLDVIKTIEGLGQSSEIRIHGDSVYTAPAAGGILREVALSSGVTTNEWETDRDQIASVTVEPDYIWFNYRVGLGTSGVARIDRSTNVIEDVQMPSWLWASSLLRTSPGAPDTLWARSGADVFRFSLDGLQATHVASSDVGVSGNTAGLEISEDGSLVWWASERLYELDASSLLETQRSQRIERVREATSDIAVNSLNSGVATIGQQAHAATIRYFADASSTADLEVILAGEAVAVAATSEEVLTLVRFGANWELHAVGVDYRESTRVVNLFVDRHGLGPEQPELILLSCQDHSAVVEARYGEWTSLSIPADERHCALDHLVSDDIESMVGLLSYLSRDGDSLGSWEMNEATQVMFDPVLTSAVSILDFGLSPVSNISLFVEQTYLDVAGRAPTDAERDAQVERIRARETTQMGFVLEMMDTAGEYETMRAPLARLYEAFFLRPSDPSGMAYWLGVRKQGVSVIQVSEFFTGSQEFQQLYGYLNDRQFVDLVYGNVLRRTPDASGYAFWIDQMENGLSRGDLMVYFSGSPEYRGLTEARSFAVYAVRTLELRDPSPADIQALTAIYEESGRAGVVYAIVSTSGYSSRFWASSTTQNSMLLAELETVDCGRCSTGRDVAADQRGFALAE